MDLTFGGPVYIPKLINGRNKLFFFFNYGWNNELRIGPNGSGITTVPTAANLAGDFSSLLQVGPQYTICRSADRSAGPGAARPLHPHAIPREHRSRQPDHQPDVQRLREVTSAPRTPRRRRESSLLIIFAPKATPTRSPTRSGSIALTITSTISTASSCDGPTAISPKDWATGPRTPCHSWRATTRCGTRWPRPSTGPLPPARIP